MIFRATIARTVVSTGEIKKEYHILETDTHENAIDKFIAAVERWNTTGRHYSCGVVSVVPLSTDMDGLIRIA